MIKPLQIIIAASLCFVSWASLQRQIAETVELEIMTFNLRYANDHDGINNWSNRREHVFEIINRFHPAIMGIQEGLEDQLYDLHSNLNGNYQRFGLPREENGGTFILVFSIQNTFSHN